MKSYKQNTRRKIMEDRTMEILGKYLDEDFCVSPMAPNQSTIDDVKAIEKTYK
jgi:hypothetical protein